MNTLRLSPSRRGVPPGDRRICARARAPRRWARLAPLALALATAGLAGEALAQSTVTLPVLRNGGVLRGVLAPLVSGSTMTINQTAARGVIEWSNFSIGQGGTVNIVQPDGTSVLLNRVIGNTSGSVIDGALNANGRVFVVDPSGVVFGANARVNVGGLVASALDLRNGAADYDAFVAGGGLQLVTPLGNPGLVGTNEGAQIATPVGGQVMLLSGQTLLHDGAITARQGQVTLAAGGSATLGIGSSGFITLDLGRATPGQSFYTSPQIITGVNSVIDVSADSGAGGSVRLQASGDVGLESVPRVTLLGRVDASSAGGAGGGIDVSAGPEGTVELGGTLQANGGATGTGGTIKLSGQDVRIAGGFTAGAEPLVEASGGAAGGDIVITAGRNLVVSDGRLLATGIGSGATGGRIALDGFTIQLEDLQFTDTSQIDASGGRGGGSIQIGSDLTRSLSVSRDMLLRADATTVGNGGSILLSAGFVGSGQEPPGPGSSFGVLTMFGAASARGGAGGGDGGSITLRGAAVATELTGFDGSLWPGPRQPAANGLQFDATAANPGGRHGRLAVHTGNVLIDTAAVPDAGTGLFEPASADSTLTTALINATLQAGMNVDLNADVVAGSGLTLAPRAPLLGGAAPGNLTLSADHVVLGAGSRIDATGPMQVSITATGQHLILENDVALFSDAIQGGNGAVGLRLSARRDLRLAEGVVIGNAVRGGAITLTMLADTGGAGDGGIALNGDSNGGSVGIAIATAGGAVTLSGGLDPAVDAASRVDLPGIRLANARIDTGTGRIELRGRSAAGEGSTPVGVSLTDSTLNGGDITVIGASDGGTGVSLVRSGLSASGNVSVHGVATSSSRGADVGEPIGVFLQDARVTLGTGEGSGSFTLTGRAERAADATGAAPGAAGLVIDGLSITADRVNAGRITLAGEGAGLGSRGILSPGSTFIPLQVVGADGTPTAADVVIGAQSDASGQALDLRGSAPVVRTTGTVNIRPLGVDVHGALVEQGGTVIQIGNAVGQTARHFVVPGSWLIDAAVDGRGSFQVGRMVIGSSAQRGLIEVGALALPATPHADLTLQNGGAGSQGIVLGGGIDTGGGNTGDAPANPGLQATAGLSQLTLITDGPVTQLDVLQLQRLVIQGSQGTADVVLDRAGNRIGELAASNLGRLVVRSDDTAGLTITDATASGWSTGSPSDPAVVNGVSARDVVQVETAGDLNLQAGAVQAFGAGGRIDLIAGGVFRNSANATLSTGSGGRWRVWSSTWEGMVTGGLQGTGPTPNLYGCAWGDAGTCSVSGITLPASGSGFVFRQQPTVVVDPSRVTYAQGQPVPRIAFGSTGLVNGDSAATAFAGALGSSAGAGSAPGTYDITLGTLVSPAGYRVQLGSGAVGGVTLVAGVVGLPPGTTPHGDFSALLTRTSSEVNGRNLSRPLMCLAPGAQRRAAEGEGDDLLGLEWGRVRHQPQLSSCLDLGDDGQCAAF